MELIKYYAYSPVKVNMTYCRDSSAKEIDLIIEENGTLYPVEIKKGVSVAADQTSAFTVLDDIPEKKRGMGAIICLCPQPGMLRENILQLPVWYI